MTLDAVSKHFEQHLRCLNGFCNVRKTVTGYDTAYPAEVRFVNGDVLVDAGNYDDVIGLAGLVVVVQQAEHVERRNTHELGVATAERLVDVFLSDRALLLKRFY